jgi:hypothetical protein
LIGFAKLGCNSYIPMAARKPFDIPMQVVRAFAKDMRAYHAEPNTTKRVEIAERQLDVLQGFQGPRDKKLQLRDVTALFEEMKDLQ